MKRARHIGLVLGSFLLSMSGGIFSAQAADTPWEHMTSPSDDAPQAIGGYANGCLAGGVALPLDGDGYQVLRPQNHRYYGHPNTVAFVERLAKQMQSERGTQLLIGDMALPQGGRFSSGHASHQSGLDVDIWLRLANTPLSDDQLKLPTPYSVVDMQGYQMRSERWDNRHFELIKMAASSPEVARIFVHPVIKEQLCMEERSRGKARLWLRKVRPWWGHNYHFHVRLTCPKGDFLCHDQAPPPRGDGCGSELASWRPKPESEQPKAVEQPKKTEPVLPSMCQALLDRVHG
ncbi:penicillin-insensitive murein endopeptidase [Vibrio xiamenensis]|uniref:Penicillin-insensitive murein endopeptidase n=2 Tax=Vibrio xiamenensis TaxID=861298 RepID=A0A1G7W4E5_9VIBR|nr:penicillin-insensitive murein endopeptidase [Vibrio xiamenensis]